MALFKCPDCKTKVSTAAEKCPCCGRPVTEEDRMPKPEKRAPWKVIVICALVCMVIAAAGLNSAKIKPAWRYCSLKHCETWNILDYIIQPVYADTLEEKKDEFTNRLDILSDEKERLLYRLNGIYNEFNRDELEKCIKSLQNRIINLESMISDLEDENDTDDIENTFNELEDEKYDIESRINSLAGAGY